MRRITSYCYWTALQILMVLCICLLKPEPMLGQELPEEKPLLTLACISDIHTERGLITDINNIGIRGSFSQTLTRIKNEEKIDVLLLGGDCTSDATIPQANWEKVRKMIANYSRKAFQDRSNTPVLYVTGNHDYEVANWYDLPKSYNAGDYYTYPMKEDIGELTADESFYEDADNADLGKMTLLAAYHYVIHGFDFVILNCGKHQFRDAGYYEYSVESVQWVADKLAEIYAEDPGKTVFFALHIPFGDSNSIRSASKGIVSSAGEKLLKSTLAKYPNLIMLYGHDHGEDKAYTRIKTSQRVTRYDHKGAVIDTYDDTHVDGKLPEGYVPEGYVPEDATEPTENGKWSVYNEAAGMYLGFNSVNISAVSEVAAVQFTPLSSTPNTFSVTVSGSGSEANGNFLYSGSSGRFSANTNACPTYIYKVSEMNASGIKAELTTDIIDGGQYVLVTQNYNNKSEYYALTSEIYNGNRLVGLKVTRNGNEITLKATDTKAVWTISKYTQPAGEPSFFSAYMGSMRYYYNTIDPGDMPVETPNIVQALMIYVYKDRVELHMKNYNKSGTINGITVNKYLVPYISYREVKDPNTAINDIELKDYYTEPVRTFDLNGRAQTSPQRGINLVGNRKMLVK